MKHLRLAVAPDGFYGAYRAFPAAGKYPKESRRTRINIEERICRNLAEWKGAK